MSATTYIINNDVLGTVTVRVNPRANRISGRWKLGKAVITVPAGITKSRLDTAINSIAARLAARKPAFRYSENQIISCPGIQFELSRQSFKPDNILISSALPVTKIQLGTNIDLNSDAATTTVSKILERIAHNYAPALLLPRARELAKSLGTEPASWQIGRGLRTLGTCSSRKVITLSSTLVFMPMELRDYIVCHELAHLKEMNHSVAFHALCDRYLNGREAELIAKLKAFPYPILR